MKKRDFLCSLLAAAPWPVRAKRPAATSVRSAPAILTVTGAIARTNRPGFDKVFDVLMGKHGVAFDRAYAFDYAMVARLPVTTISATLEYDGQKHALSGPLLTDVLQAAGATPSDSTRLSLRAVDGYAPQMTLADARRFGFIVATHRDAKPLALGGLGPLWAVYAADRFADMMAKPLSQRFATCPWGLYHIDVARA